MNRLCISTRGIGSWRNRLANPGRQWKRGFSAFETAVSWELASKSQSGIPDQIGDLFRNGGLGQPLLIFAVAEHNVDLPGGTAASQSDVWAVVKTSAGMVSLTVEAKANEAFGGEILENWLAAGKTKGAKGSRQLRFEYIRSHLPVSDSFSSVRYQILHRCAASVIEAKRLGFQHAAFVVQAFNAPAESFQNYVTFCRAINVAAARGQMAATYVDNISLSVGWADCRFASDDQVAATV
jgi:hypothetical protein